MKQTASSRTDSVLPLTLEEITPEWLTEAIGQRFPGVVVTGSDVMDVNHGTCTKVRLRLAVNAEGRAAGIPETVILKGGFEPHSREMYVTHEKEVRAYRDLFSELKLHSPACYFAGLDGSRQQGIVIIEDLVARGVRFCHPQRPETPDAVAQRLSALAAFHARSWADPALRSGGRWSWAHDTLLESLSYMDRYLSPEIWDYYVREPRGAAVAVQFHDREWMSAALKALPIIARDLPRCLVHGDTHLGNLYVDPDGTPGFFDPQPMQAPSMLEVTYHIAGALDPAERPRWERQLVAQYLDELRGHGVAAPDIDSAMQQYAAFLVLGYCIFLINAADFQPEAINTAYTARFSAAMLDHDSFELIRRVHAGK